MELPVDYCFFFLSMIDYRLIFFGVSWKISKKVMKFRFSQKLKPKSKKKHERNVFIFLFYVQLPNFSKTGPQTKNFLKIFHDPLKNFILKHCLELTHETGRVGILAKNARSSYLAVYYIYSSVHSLCFFFLIIILHSLTRSLTLKILCRCDKVHKVKCFCLECSTFFVINAFFH